MEGIGQIAEGGAGLIGNLGSMKKTTGGVGDAVSDPAKITIGGTGEDGGVDDELKKEFEKLKANFQRTRKF